MIELRKFSLSDLDEILEIEKVSFPKEAFSQSYFEKLYQEYPEGFIVAKNNNKVVGYTIGQLKNELVEIISLAINPDWRRKGIGKTLTNFLINHFKEKRVKEIFLHVRTENKTSISFYQNFDFKILKTVGKYYPNGDNAYLMRKEMGGYLNS